MHQQYFSPKTNISYSKKKNNACLCILGKITAKYMFVWWVLLRNFPEVLQQSVFAFQRAELLRRLTWSSERGARWSDFSGDAALRAQLAISPGDRWSISGVVLDKHRRGTTEFSTPRCPTCVAVSTFVHVGVSAGSSLMKEKSEKFSPPCTRIRLKCPR